jgi:hypothetical protein
MTAAYERILELAQREAALVDEGRFEELATVWAERDDVIGVLEETPPASAREPLLEADRICRATRASLLSQLQELGVQIGRLSSGRRAAAGYGGATAPRSLDARG